MDAWLKTHVALVSPIANAIYAAGGDNYRLARTRDAIVLMIRAMREGYTVLRANHIPITPAKLKIIEWIPEPLLVALLQLRLPTKSAELNLARHANHARDEMQQIADEFRVLARKAGVKTPAIDQLYGYLDPAVSILPEGKHELRIHWLGILATVVPFIGLAIVGRWLRPRHGH
jgi:2-dehydropantoate 2-reductase